MTTRRIVGITLALIGGVMASTYVVGLLDPTGTQLADDADPFGSPRSLLSGGFGLLLSVGAALFGAWLIFSSRRAGRQASGDEHR